MTRPRLLFIAPAMPQAAGNGLAMRQAQFLAAYARAFEVDLAVVPVAGPSDADGGFAQILVRRLKIFRADAVDTHFGMLCRLADPGQRCAAFAAYGKPSLSAHLTAGLRQEFSAWCGQVSYDAVHVGRLYMLPLAALCADVPKFVDADEDDARVHHAIAALARRRAAPAAAWAEIEALNAARQAADLLPGMARVFAAGPADAAMLAAYNANMTVIPNMAAPAFLRPRRRGRKILFVGTLGYAPNDDGLCWFIAKIWPLIRKQQAARLDIIGTGASARLRRLARQPGIRLHGYVADLASHYGTARLVIVPLRAGGGSRIKMLEAAAHAVPVVATRCGAEGSLLRPGRDFLRAEAPRGFANHVLALLQSPVQAAKIGVAARRAVRRHHDADMWRRRIAQLARAAVA